METGEETGGLSGYLEESDVVARRIVKTDPVTGHTRTTVKLGLVSEVYEDSESSEDDDKSSNESGSLRLGQALVEWYPSGKESRVEEERVVVVDRTLMLGELVTRQAADGKTLGIVLDVDVTADLTLLPPTKEGHVLARRNLHNLNFANPFDASSNSNYVFHDDWVGALTEVRERLLLRAEKGYKCWLNASDTDDVRDFNCRNRKVGSSFDISQWYEGQELVVPFENLRHADWIAQFKPPERIRRSISNRSHGKLHMTIEKVKLVGLAVDWMCWTMGERESGSQQRPPTLLEGEETLKTVYRLDWFEYQTAQIGDRMSGTMEDGDVIQTREEWETSLSRLVAAMKSVALSDAPEPKPNLKHKADSLHSSDAPEESAGESMGEEEDEEAEGTTTVQPGRSLQSSPEAYFTASESSATLEQSTLEQSTLDQSSAFLDVSETEPKPKPRAGKKGPARQKKEKPKKRKEKKSLHPPGPPAPGQSFVAEVVLQQSKVSVLWMDGTIERGIPAAHLRYNQEDLDEHVFFAGAFVEPLTTTEGAEVSGFGFVHAVDADERIATVSWYNVSGLTDPEPVLRQKEQVSEMDLRPFTHFSLAPGTGVIRAKPLPPSDKGHPLRNVGQVTGYELPTGRIMVKWFTGVEEAVWPTTIIRAFDSYDPDDPYWSEGEDYNSAEWTDVSGSSAEESETEEAKEKIHLSESRKAKLLATAKELLGTLEKGQRTLMALRSKECVPHRVELCGSVLAWLRALHRLAKLSGEYDPTEHVEYETVRGYRRAIRLWIQALHRGNGETLPPQPEKGNRSGLDFVEALMRESAVVRNYAAGEAVAETEEARFAATGAFVKSCVAQICGPNAVERAGSEHELIQVLMTQSQEASFASFSDPQSLPSLASIDIMLFSLLQISSLMVEDLQMLLRSDSSGRSDEMDVHISADPAGRDGDSTSPSSTLSQATVIEETVTDAGVPSADAAMDVTDAEAVPSPAEEAAAVPVPDSAPGEPSTPMDVEATPPNATTPEPTPTPSEKAQDNFGKGALEVLPTAPMQHIYRPEAFTPDGLSRHWYNALRNELKLLRNSLPPGLIVKTYEDRSDLFSCLMTGPEDTPFHDSLFFFDIRLPEQYPNQPPLVYYKSYSAEQLNPNLYQSGKVCVSLLGTWSGKGSEKWNPGSNLLQVLVSIQGLILNSEPYFNEAGYECRKGAGAEYAEKSRRYNEMCVLRSLDNLVRMARSPPVGFEHEVGEHVRRRGPELEKKLSGWMGIPGFPVLEVEFPLAPVSAGFKLTAKRYLSDLQSVLPSS